RSNRVGVGERPGSLTGGLCDRLERTSASEGSNHVHSHHTYPSRQDATGTGSEDQGRGEDRGVHAGRQPGDRPQAGNQAGDASGEGTHAITWWLHLHHREAVNHTHTSVTLR